MSFLGLDTHPKAARAQLALLRAASIEKRAALAISLSSTVIRLSRQALRERMPGARDAEIMERWVELNYGPDLAARLRDHLRARNG